MRWGFCSDAQPFKVRITPFRISEGVIALLSPLSSHGSSILNAAIHNISVSDSSKDGLANRNINTDEGTKPAHRVLYDPAPAIKSAIKSQTGIISKSPTPFGRTCCYAYTPFFELRYSNLISALNL